MGFTHLLAGGVQAYRRIVADCVPGRWGWPDLSAAGPELRLSRQIKRDVGRQNSGPVVYANRIQTLTSHLDDNEEIQLTLDTAGAASFTFVANDVPVGDHTITAQARVVTSGFSDWEALGAVGKGSLTVEEVRMVNGQ